MCNGKCYLNKTLKEAKENEKKATLNIREDLAKFIIDSAPLWIHQTKFSLILNLCNFSYFNNILTQNFLIEIFHPPQMI